jgi:DNA-binding transcriptional LysR family regulator
MHPEMKDIQLRKLDLNALVALDALLSEGEVGRAAERVGVSASAMSHTLRRLRDLFDDPLLVKGRGGMTPTPRAEALRTPLNRALLELQRAISIDPDFAPVSSTREFRVATNDYGDLILLPGLLAALSRSAPNVRLSASPLDPEASSLPLETGAVELAITHPLEKAPGIFQKTLFEDDFCCVARSDHPALRERLDRATYAELTHLRLAPRGPMRDPLEQALAREGVERRVGLVMSNFSSAPLIVAASDLLLTAPRRCVEAWARILPLRVLETPFETPRFSIAMVWHERFQHDSAHRWLRQQVAAVGAGGAADA